jgi:NADH-quinone oxidoreductase subunit C
VTIDELRDHLCATYPDLCPLFSIEYGDGVLVVQPEQLHAAAADLKNLGFDLLGLLVAVDYGAEFELVYRIRARDMHAGIFLKTRVPRENPVVRSVVDLWPAANWHEREAFDLMGIHFDGHPDLRRILLTDDWVGHPLRKDYVDARTVRRPDYI